MVVTRSQRQRQPSVSESASAMSTDTAMSTTTGYQPSNISGMIGPANWVDPVTYRKLRSQFRKGYTKKRAGAKKTTGRKRQYRRYSYGRGGSLQGMGPIVITGRGGYFSDKLRQGASAGWRALKRLTPQGTFERLGTAAGGGMFGAPGAVLGGALGSGVSNVLGFGDYAVSKNDLLQVHEGVPVPTFADLNQGIVICHREFIKDVIQTADFTNDVFVINPGEAKTFPWLHQVASQFEQYEILGCLFQFRSTSSDFGAVTNMAMGSLIMATDYDVHDDPYASKLEMENAQYTISGKPSQDMLHPLECDPSLVGPAGIKYVRHGPPPTNTDKRLFDHGNFQIATTGMPASDGVIGELWVTYKIAFYKPCFSKGEEIKSDTFTASAPSAIEYWGSSIVPHANNSLGCSIVANTITFPVTAVPGMKFLIVHDIVGSAASVTAPALTFLNATVLENTASAGTNVIRYFHRIIIEVTGTPVTVTAAATAALPGTPVVTRLMITQFDKDLL